MTAREAINRAREHVGALYWMGGGWTYHVWDELQMAWWERGSEPYRLAVIHRRESIIRRAAALAGLDDPGWVAHDCGSIRAGEQRIAAELSRR
jgi:hypothetical protein